MRLFLPAFVYLFLQSSDALAHASGQQLVLLLPTEFYNMAGVAIVVLTVLLLSVPSLAGRITNLTHIPLAGEVTGRLMTATSLLSTGVLAIALIAGLTGSRDPLLNPLPLLVWTIWWVGLVIINGVVGNLWQWINPWSGIYQVAVSTLRLSPLFDYPKMLGFTPAIAGFFLFSSFLLAHPAPDDPAILAQVVGTYWLVTFAGMVLFGGKVWSTQGEFMNVMMVQLSRSAIFGNHDGKLNAGIPGWKLGHPSQATVGLGVFVLLLLGTSSFDGFNETFKWLALLDINPLEFPGRSAVIPQTLGGILLANLLLLVSFTSCLFAGLRMSRASVPLRDAFVQVAPTILPIAVGYHFAHYLTTFMVASQYAVISASDPFSNGSNYFGTGKYYVTTGFFNTPDSVRRIFLAQAFAVVAGHVISIISAHRVMKNLLRDTRQVTLSQIPMAIFMTAYTFFGLWLLAAPRGA